MFFVFIARDGMPLEETDSEEKSDLKQDVTSKSAKRGVFSHVGTFFGWLGDLISEQARIEAQKEDAKPPLHIRCEISHQRQNISEVIINAETICTHLDEIKISLTSQFGSAASCFISKCIDPMIDHARHLIKALKEPATQSDSINTLLNQAIESVELYSQFNDEVKLKQRIVLVAQGFIKQSIDKDLEVLANYKRDAIIKSGWSNEEKQSCEFQLDGYLYPMISELIGMAESRVITDDLHAFFVWKSNVDERRNSLVELGFLTIDAMIKTNEQTDVMRYDDEDDEIVLEEPFDQLIAHQLENSSLAMSYMATLEDRVSDIFVRLEDLHFKDASSVDVVEQLLDYLKVDAERFRTISTHTKHVLDSFKTIKQNIIKAESLLLEKKS